MWDWTSRLAELARAGQPLVVVTVVTAEGSAPREVGAKMLVTADGSFHGSIGGGHLERLAIADALAALGERGARTVRYPLGPKAGQCCGGTVELLFEVLNVGPRLLLFGAGHVGRALCRVLEPTPFRIDLVDDRPEWIDSPEIPDGVTRHAVPWDLVGGDLAWDAEHTFVAIMTHRHDVDQEIVAWAIARPARYIGLIGSQTKWAKFQARLRERGVSDDALARVKCPIGLPLGGKSPGEVAISIAAELLGEYHRKPRA